MQKYGPAPEDREDPIEVSAVSLQPGRRAPAQKGHEDTQSHCVTAAPLPVVLERAWVAKWSFQIEVPGDHRRPWRVTVCGDRLGSLSALPTRQQVFLNRGRFLTSARLRRYALLKALGLPQEAILPSYAPSPAADLAQFETTLRNHAAEPQKSATAEERKKLKAELVESTDREFLAASCKPSERKSSV